MNYFGWFWLCYRYFYLFICEFNPSYIYLGLTEFFLTILKLLFFKDCGSILDLRWSEPNSATLFFLFAEPSLFRFKGGIADCEFFCDGYYLIIFLGVCSTFCGISCIDYLLNRSSYWFFIWNLGYFFILIVLLDLHSGLILLLDLSSTFASRINTFPIVVVFTSPY